MIQTGTTTPQITNNTNATTTEAKTAATIRKSGFVIFAANKVARQPCRLTMRLSDAGLRQRRTKAVYPDHRSSPWPIEYAARDRSNRLLDARGMSKPSEREICGLSVLGKAYPGKERRNSKMRYRDENHERNGCNKKSAAT